MEINLDSKAETVLNNLAIRQEITPERVILQSLRLYQLLVEGLIEVKMTRESLKEFYYF